MPRLNVMSSPVVKPNNSTKFFCNVGGLFRQVSMAELKKFVGSGSGGTGGGGVSPEDLEGYVFVEEPAEGEEAPGETFEPVLNADALSGKSSSYFAPQSCVGDAFDETKAYLKNDFCIYENTLCKFVSPKEAGPWDGTKVIAVSVMDEIQTLHNANVLSYDEARIGTWIDGKPLYRKMIDFGSLPSSGYKTLIVNVQNIAHGHVNLGKSFWGNLAATPADCYTFVFLPNISYVSYRGSNNDIVVQVVKDSSEYQAIICFEYTKTTDSPGQ